MKNWREWKILKGDLLNSDYVSGYDGSIDKNTHRAPLTFLWVLIGFLAFGIPTIILADVVSGLFLIPGLLIMATMAWKAPVLGREHVMYGIRGQMKYRADFYYDCDAVERTFYPYNIEELFRIDTDKLVGDDRYNLEHQLFGLENDIRARRRARRELLEIKPDIASTLKEIEMSREGLKSDIETYKELS